MFLIDGNQDEYLFSGHSRREYSREHIPQTIGRRSGDEDEDVACESMYETEVFSLENESIYTSSQIIGEDLLKKRRCLDEFYCLIELEMLIDDGRIYLIVPIHVFERVSLSFMA